MTHASPDVDMSRLDAEHGDEVEQPEKTEKVPVGPFFGSLWWREVVGPVMLGLQPFWTLFTTQVVLLPTTGVGALQDAPLVEIMS